MQITEDMLRRANEADRARMDAHVTSANMLAGAIRAREALIAEMQKPEPDEAPAPEGEQA